MTSLARPDLASSNDSKLPASSTSSVTLSSKDLADGEIRGLESSESRDQQREPANDEISEAYDEPTSARSLSEFPAFLTPPHSLSPRSRVSSLSLQRDSSDATLPTTQVSPQSRLGFSPSSSSPLASTSFDPVVGGGRAPQAPTCSRVYSMRSPPPAKPSRESASLPTTPSNPNLASSSSLFSPNFAPLSSHPVATWPPRPLAGSTFDAAERSRGPLPVEPNTPTNKGTSESLPRLLVPDEIRFDLFEGKELATRYVLVEGIDKTSTEQELKNFLVHPYTHLSLKGCTTSRLGTDGMVVLAFHDVRHALFTARQISAAQTPSLGGGKASSISASCMTREALEQQFGNDEPNSLLSTSEGVLVYTTTSSRTTPPPLLSIYGELRSSKIVEDKIHVVEFFDDRSAEKALRGLGGTQRNGVSYDCSFEPSSSDLPPPSPFDFAAIPSPQLPRSTAHFAPVTSPFDAFSPTLTPTTPPQFASALSSSFASFPQARSFPSPSIWQDGGSWHSHRQQLNSSPWFDSVPRSPRQSASFGIGQLFAEPRFDQPSLHRSALSSPPLSPQSASFRPGPSTSYVFPPILPTTRPLNEPRSPSDQQASATLSPRNRLPPSFGIVRDDRIPVGNVINYERIEQGLEVRTTLMLKNVPNKLKDVEVMNFIEEVVGRSYDFFYLRTDYATGCNVGYGFVNFTSMSALLAFCRQRLGTRWNLCNSDKLCVLSFANIQGKASLINHFKNSSVLDQDESRRPKLFVTSGPNAGQPETFPVCDDPVRKMRSALNAANVGLFPSQKPVFKIAQAFQGMNL
ncbi:hypothetical protein JCM11491_006816 [Sporobolomyces phaffii]